MGVNIFSIVCVYEMIKSHQNIILLRIGTRSGATAFYKHKHAFLRPLECSIGSLAFQARESLEILGIYKKNLVGCFIGNEDEQNPGRTTGSGDGVHEVSEGNKRITNFTIGFFV